MTPSATPRPPEILSSVFCILYSVLFLLCSTASAADGIDPRRSAADYPAHVTAGKLEIGAAYVPAAQVRKWFGDDLEKHGYVVFEIGVFPADGAQVDVSPDDFKLRQGKDPAIERAATPHEVAVAVHPKTPTSDPPKPPSKVNVTTVETVGYETGRYGRGVYTGTEVGVGVGGGTPNGPPPPPASAGGQSQADLQMQLESQVLPETKTTKPIGGYIFFPKPPAGKAADFELLYFGIDGQVTLKLSK